MKLLPVFCGRDCGGDACPLLARIDAGRVISIGHNPDAGPYVRGCAKGYRLHEFHYSKERLHRPMLRNGPRGSGQFREVAWDTAMEYVAAGLSRAIERGGASSIMDMSSAGSLGALHNTGALTRRFLNSLGGCTALEGSYSSNAASHVLKKIFGAHYGESGLDPETVKDAALIILWGANILEARLGAVLSASVIQAGKQGVPVISVDPRCTSTTKRLGAAWIPIKPGTDVPLLYSILYILDQEKLLDRDLLESRAADFEAILSHVKGESDGIPKTPAWSAGICGISMEQIQKLAHLWKTSHPLMIIPGYSIQRTAWGEEAMRLLVLLQLGTGNFGVTGGSTGSLNNRLPGARIETIGVGDESANRTVPILRWPDAILSESTKDHVKIEAAYSAGGNFLNQGADIRKNIRALESLDFLVGNELFMTPTARYCDVVLPAASPLQKEDIGIPWDGRYLLYKPKILPYVGDERSDFEIFAEISRRMGCEDRFSGGMNEDSWIERFLLNSEISDIDTFKRTGFYAGNHEVEHAVRDFAANPLRNPLGTASGKLEFGGSEGGRYTAGEPDHRNKEFPYLLITPKRADRVHSQGGDMIPEIFHSELMIHPQTANENALADGDRAVLKSENGQTIAVVRLSGDIAEGVVSLFEGAWFAESDSTGSANLLTSTEGTRESTSCIMHGIPVAIRKQTGKG